MFADVMAGLARRLMGCAAWWWCELEWGQWLAGVEVEEEAGL